MNIEQKKRIILEVEYTLDFERLIVRDVSHFHPVWFIKKNPKRFGQNFVFDGKSAWVMVVDPFKHLTREIALKAANAFITGKVETYEYND